MPPSTPGGALDCTLRARARAVRLPEDHPAARNQEAGRLSQTTILLHEVSQGSSRGSWPERYAAEGRAMAGKLLQQLALGPEAISKDTMPDWGSTMASPPRLTELRWNAAFQRDLLRGWIGRIDGLQTVDHDDKPITSRARLEELLRHGQWQKQPEDGAYSIWHRENDDAWLSIRSDDGGHDVAVWWERPHAAELFSQWLDAAVDGVEPKIEHQARLQDRDIAAAAPTPQEERGRARAQLEHYRGCPVIPLDYRLKADALLHPGATAAGGK